MSELLLNRESKYIKCLLNPAASEGVSIPDDIRTLHAVKSLTVLSNYNITALTTDPVNQVCNGLILLWHNSPNNTFGVLYPFNNLTNIFDIASGIPITPSQDLSQDYNYVRTIAGVLGIQCATISTTNFTTSGVFAGLRTESFASEIVSEIYTPGQPFSDLMSTLTGITANSYDKILNTKAIEGVKILALPDQFNVPYIRTADAAPVNGNLNVLTNRVTSIDQDLEYTFYFNNFAPATTQTGNFNVDVPPNTGYTISLGVEGNSPLSTGIVGISLLDINGDTIGSNSYSVDLSKASTGTFFNFLTGNYYGFYLQVSFSSVTSVQRTSIQLNVANGSMNSVIRPLTLLAYNGLNTNTQLTMSGTRHYEAIPNPQTMRNVKVSVGRYDDVEVNLVKYYMSKKVELGIKSMFPWTEYSNFIMQIPSFTSIDRENAAAHAAGIGDLLSGIKSVIKGGLNSIPLIGPIVAGIADELIPTSAGGMASGGMAAGGMAAGGRPMMIARSAGGKPRNSVYAMDEQVFQDAENRDECPLIEYQVVYRQDPEVNMPLMQFEEILLKSLVYDKKSDIKVKEVAFSIIETLLVPEFYVINKIRPEIKVSLIKLQNELLNTFVSTDPINERESAVRRAISNVIDELQPAMAMDEEFEILCQNEKASTVIVKSLNPVTGLMLVTYDGMTLELKLQPTPQMRRLSSLLNLPAKAMDEEPTDDLLFQDRINSVYTPIDGPYLHDPYSVSVIDITSEPVTMFPVVLSQNVTRFSMYGVFNGHRPELIDSEVFTLSKDGYKVYNYHLNNNISFTIGRDVTLVRLHAYHSDTNLAIIKRKYVEGTSCLGAIYYHTHNPTKLGLSRAAITGSVVAKVKGFRTEPFKLMSNIYYYAKKKYCKNVNIPLIGVDYRRGVNNLSRYSFDEVEFEMKAMPVLPDIINFFWESKITNDDDVAYAMDNLTENEAEILSDLTSLGNNIETLPPTLEDIGRNTQEEQPPMVSVATPVTTLTGLGRFKRSLATKASKAPQMVQYRTAMQESSNEIYNKLRQNVTRDDVINWLDETGLMDKMAILVVTDPQGLKTTNVLQNLTGNQLGDDALQATSLAATLARAQKVLDSVKDSNGLGDNINIEWIIANNFRGPNETQLKVFRNGGVPDIGTKTVVAPTVVNKITQESNLLKQAIGARDLFVEKNLKVAKQFPVLEEPSVNQWVISGLSRGKTLNTKAVSDEFKAFKSMPTYSEEAFSSFLHSDAIFMPGEQNFAKTLRSLEGSNIPETYEKIIEPGRMEPKLPKNIPKFAVQNTAPKPINNRLMASIMRSRQGGNV
jgi:hypothetical protein